MVKRYIPRHATPQFAGLFLLTIMRTSWSRGRRCLPSPISTISDQGRPLENINNEFSEGLSSSGRRPEQRRRLPSKQSPSPSPLVVGIAVSRGVASVVDAGLIVSTFQAHRGLDDPEREWRAARGVLQHGGKCARRGMLRAAQGRGRRRRPEQQHCDGRPGHRGGRSGRLGGISEPTCRVWPPGNKTTKFE